MESVSGDAVFSIETRYHEVAEAALDAGFDMVNDICGFADPEMPRVCAERDVAVAKMASPPDLERPGAVEAVDDIYDALQREGLTDKTIVDPAFGGWSEAKTLEDDRETFRRLREFRALDRPILVSINRKNFLRDLAGRSTEEALPVSLAATAMAVERGAHVIRTHDVAETRDAALIGKAFTRDRLQAAGGVTVEELDVTSVGEMRRHLDRVGGEASAAGRGVVRTFELSGLSPGERETLVDAARSTPVVVAGDGATRLLAGTPADLSAVVEAASGRSDALDAALSVIADDGA
jgi:dihydropteroate synthase